MVNQTVGVCASQRKRATTRLSSCRCGGAVQQSSPRSEHNDRSWGVVGGRCCPPPRMRRQFSRFKIARWFLFTVVGLSVTWFLMKPFGSSSPVWLCSAGHSLGCASNMWATFMPSKL
uniref:Uncharacterized protein n=1 Tax=Rhipicephalus appendiculatus TaxID=34631 RepID=A0A131YC39_RHIAP